MTAEVRLASACIAGGWRSPPLIAASAERYGALLLRRGRKQDAVRGSALVAEAAAIAQRIGKCALRW